MNAMRPGTYAREADGAGMLYHSREFYMDAAYALRTAGTWWRRVDDPDERAGVEKFLCGGLMPGEFVEYQGEGCAYVVGGPC
jgi:hypothetical protein